jgi:hypothetical protein
MATNNTTSTAKTHVSLRLPTYILESIDAHAERENISRTEAFVYYLQTGLNISDSPNQDTADENTLQAIQEELAEIKHLLESQQLTADQIEVKAPGEPAPEKNYSAAQKAQNKPEEKKTSFSYLTGSGSASHAQPVKPAVVIPATQTSEVAHQTEEPEEQPVKKLAKAVAQAAKEISSIEKVWLYDLEENAKGALDKAVTLCVKTTGDKKLKDKQLAAFVATIQEKAGKTAEVILKHEIKDKSEKQALKSKTELYKAK